MIRQVSGVAARPAAIPIDFQRIKEWAASSSGIWTLWTITRGIMLVNLIVGQHYSDPQFYQYAGDLAMGKLPYISVPVEYPPLAMLFILLPAIPLLPFSAIAPRPEIHAFPPHPDPSRYGAYGISFGLCMMAIDALTLLLVMRVARRWTPGDATGHWSGLIYVALGMASGAVLQKFDLAVGTLCLLSLMLLLEKRTGLAWACLALATLTKGYPIMLAPLFLCWSYYNKQLDWTMIRRAIIGGGAACLALVGPILITSGIQPLFHSVLYHADRGIEIESTWASVMMGVSWLSGSAMTSGLSSVDLSLDIHSPLEVVMGQLAMPALLVGLSLVYLQFWRRAHITFQRYGAKLGATQESQEIMFTYLVQAIVAAMLIFMLCFRAFPAHYLLAILPLVAVLRLPGRFTRQWLMLLFASMILGQLAVSYWSQIIVLQPEPSLLLIGRNVLLIVACVVLLRAPLLDLWKAHSRSAR